ncbi:Eco57I restriction-modification methylase domain-containing protein [Rubrimonas cliftonensis]|uniref:site-specific DNA-methyltransferase (adenine-specific) n=1 Tax=Rubrimonas cliftonensis TaxID=89524 RepID=A0A1H3Z1X7_9RHOB|nr:Eco57I restriction-modification methylase domain-containing protein [Rubrimonas cliftonensis]SEA17334.1 TaqI-like C-terminal specificity domain-containing protein [Rubrimonas cliftonensis]
MLSGSLFTLDFLSEGISGTDRWSHLPEGDVDAFAEFATARLRALMAARTPNEAETESELIWPMVEALGWDAYLPQQKLPGKRREDVPDLLLFETPGDKDAAAGGDPTQRLHRALCVVESKRWLRPLDRAHGRATGEAGVPATQMLRYLRRIDDLTGGALRWGVLTNGRVWRLYFSGAVSVAEDFLEIDLGKALGLPGCELDLIDLAGAGMDADAWRRHVLKLFMLLFGREAFVATEHGETFHELARREGLQWEARVAHDLSQIVFRTVFPRLADAIARAAGVTPGDGRLDEVRTAALVLLYRLLFVLYAEDRNLLPDESGPYADYSLTRIRREVADGRAAGKTWSDRISTLWGRLKGAFGAIAQGDDALGVPPYNGGLFAPSASPLLEHVSLPDAALADVVFNLSHLEAGDGRAPKYINYRDLSVQQLGSVYERILEHGLAFDGKRVVVREDLSARRSSGSYYTPEDLVTLIIERAVGPLVAEARAEFTRVADALASDRRPLIQRHEALRRHDPASRILDLRICDPAMGSGHFLVSLVDWLADEVLEAMADAEAAAAFCDYASPLTERIATIREGIVATARARRWPLVESQLEDRHIVRRMVLKRVVYGVDKNPMAVELAKVSLWLHSFTVGAPLSFLDHHLRRGDSIVGLRAASAIDALRAADSLFNVGQIAAIEAVGGLMEQIEERTDSDLADVEASKQAYAAYEDAVGPVEALFSLLAAERMMGVIDAAPKKAPPPLAKAAGKSEKHLERLRAQHAAFERAEALQAVFARAYGDPAGIAQGAQRVASDEDMAALATQTPDDEPSLFPAITGDRRRRAVAQTLLDAAAARVAEHGFFHWEIGFPNVWSQITSTAPRGGFDAIIGNPPYVRQELLGDEVKRALRLDYAAWDGMADLYVYFYEQALRLLKPGGRLSFVVTNKWLRAGYAEALRGVFAERGELEFIADFGHAKHFFPDADVFPCVVVVRRPVPAEEPRAETDVCVIPRDAVPRKGLGGAVAAATYPLPRAHFTRESWTLEPPDVVALLEKIRRNGVPLAEYAGVKPYRGVLTGLNEAFLIDGSTRDRLVREDPGCADIIKPYLRGQDIERWHAPWQGLWMIFTRRGIDIDAYPAVKRHLEGFRERLEPKPDGWSSLEPDAKWAGRKAGSYAWFEIQDSVDYWEALEAPKLCYGDISWGPSFHIDTNGYFLNNAGYFIPTGDHWIASIMNSAVGYWLAWRAAQHGKDEALRYFNPLVEAFPIPAMPNACEADAVVALGAGAERCASYDAAILDWLHHEFGLDKPGRALGAPHLLDADGFVAAVRAVLPKKRKLSAADIARLKEEYRDTVEPARAAAAEILTLERRLSDAVNAAYGLTPEEVALMWRTAPPRMPLDPAEELRRLGAAP